MQTGKICCAGIGSDHAKAECVVQQHSIKSQSIYSYQNYDNLRNNPDMDVVEVITYLERWQ
jgi:predicted dehydrogenase